MILRPQRNFTVVRQLANHLDASTYYVRAVIRDSYTDEILATLNLDDKGGQRFTKSWLVAPDPSGLGRDISIVSSVYTDSGYTTKSENYGDEENGYLIEANNLIGRGGGSGIDAYTVRKIVKEELEKVIKEPEKVVFDYDRILQAIPQPTIQEPVDLSPVLKAIKNKKIDLEPVIQKIEENKVDIAPVLETLKEMNEEVEEEDDEEKEDTIEPVLKALADILKKMPEIIDIRFKETLKSTMKETHMELENGVDEEEIINFKKLTK